ncbi:hypothetical protein K0M31_007368 [Melipona bicolor]|uniref:Uncharacterized protein n=1 Tax=Melipona bicolor TaxID=60889 RepID=A0AA40GCN6_9HYME|nr:hypothetical protein K0M31_007368 [Melipona bicolor]
MEQGSAVCRKEGRGRTVPAAGILHYHDARGEHRTKEEVYVDRNRAAIKSYLSYCYLRRNSPQVARNEHARIVVRSAAVAERQLVSEPSSHDDDSSNVAPYAWIPVWVSSRATMHLVGQVGWYCRSDCLGRCHCHQVVVQGAGTAKWGRYDGSPAGFLPVEMSTDDCATTG